MKAVGFTPDMVHRALEAANERFGGNLYFKTFSATSRSVSFTLGVHNSRADGGRRSPNTNASGKRRAISAACWHAHGWLFHYLFTRNTPAPGAYARTGMATIKGPHYADGNWQDRNIGSTVYPCRYSEACECSTPEHRSPDGV